MKKRGTARGVSRSAVAGLATMVLTTLGCTGKVEIGEGDAAVRTGGSSTGGAGGHGGTSGDGGSLGSSGEAGVPTPRPEPKVDLLFDIDNSASMGDKQAYLVQTIPDLIARLVTPRCLDATSRQPTGQNASASSGECPSGSTPELQPVHDMHIGVVTSSLGPRLGTEALASGGMNAVPICGPTTVRSKDGTMVSAYTDDQGHLINRTGEYGSRPGLTNTALAEGGGFLSWFPELGNTGASPVIPSGSTIVPDTTVGAAGMPGTLIGDFTELVQGAGESGCGIESQLESWYRFLIQPDPYESLVLTTQAENEVATWSGIDTTIIQQRHDFLRPDSVVAIVVLTDENDSEIDVRSFQGSGYNFMSNTYTPGRATAVCFTNPNDASCQPCSPASASDPSCAINGGVYTPAHDSNDWGYDLNLRHVHMEQKYGISPQFPLGRYVNGLTSPRVPNRFGEYPSSTSGYIGENNCTNPLFASTLPTASDVADATALNPREGGTLQGGGALCALPMGTTRNPSDVFFAHIGGVPHQLLQATPGDGTCPAGTAAEDCPQKPALSSADWVKILGQGPAAYRGTGPMSFDYTGIDPHMVEADGPRNVATLTNAKVSSNPAESTLSGPQLGTGADPLRPDPINGREWTTSSGKHSLNVDREYACIFELPPTAQRDCAALPSDSIEYNSCDCVPGTDKNGNPTVTGNTPDQIPPLCSKASTDGTLQSAVGDYTVQTYAKAYPTIRELMVANMMGAQGIVSSLCPIHTIDNAEGNDPLYGYRPALDALVTKMKNGLPFQPL